MLAVEARERMLATQNNNAGAAKEIFPQAVGDIGKSRDQAAHDFKTNGRYVSDAQRGMIAARIENMPQGRPEKDANLHDIPVSRAQAAEMINVSTRVGNRREGNNSLP
jgi:hypothetical protein